MARRAYRCEFCDKVFDTLEEADECEVNHVEKGEVVLLHGDEVDVGLLGRWPNKIVVVAGDKGRVFGITGDYIPDGAILERIKQEIEEREKGDSDSAF